MSRNSHKILTGLFAGIVIAAFMGIFIYGISYYRIPLEERYFHPDHSLLKPSGIFGHGLGIIGSLLIITGVFSYMARKRYRLLSRMGIIRHWLDFHIFLCTLGPILVLFHTALKFGGIVAVSFWSMVAVFFSGVIGRFIYIRIPRSIEGRELTLNEIREMRNNVTVILRDSYNLDTEIYKGKSLREVRKILKSEEIPKAGYRKLLSLIKEDLALSRKIRLLDKMQRLFNYWHVAHLPFALIMLVIMIIHVGVTLVLGYKWIF